MNRKDFFIYFIIISSLLVVGYLGINRISYFDAPNLCYISISKDILRGNRTTIIDSLRSIKKANREDYKTVCKYVNRISESFCIASDWHLDPNWMISANGKSCYIQGSRTIYLYPQQENGSAIVKQRASDITKLSKLSKNFWDNH